jgi:hypothetical protein
MRLLTILIALLFVPAAVLQANATERHPLKDYVAAVDTRIDVYRSLLRRLEKAFEEQPQVNVDPFVETLDRIADRLDDLEGQWERVAAPRGLKVRHRGMGRTYVLLADAYRIYAAAVFTRHPEEIQAVAPQVKSRFSSAAYLQKRWAAALRGALLRAGLHVPSWLRGMATAPSP